MEVCQTVLPLDFINTQFDLAEAMVFVLSKVSERDLDDPALE